MRSSILYNLQVQYTEREQRLSALTHVKLQIFNLSLGTVIFYLHPLICIQKLFISIEIRGAYFYQCENGGLLRKCTN